MSDDLYRNRLLQFASERLGSGTHTAVVKETMRSLGARLQRVVDRRFNRARYDADAMVVAFVSRLRGAVDLEAVEPALITTVQRAFDAGRQMGQWSG